MNNVYGKSIQSKVKRYYKWYGFRKGVALALQRVLTKLLLPLIDYHKMFVFRKNLQDNKKCITQNRTIEMNYLNDSNMKSFKEVVKKYSWHDTVSFIEPRLQDKENCVLANFTGHICAFLWVATGRRTVSYRSKKFLIKDSEVFIRDLLTVPVYRGRGIITTMIGNVSESLREKGCKYMIGFVSSDNYSSIKAFQKNGFKIYQVARFVNSPFLRNELSFIKTI